MSRKWPQNLNPWLPVPKPTLKSQQESIFDVRSLADIYDEIRQVYLSDKRPWVVGYSGGKDSTCALQLVWSALEGLESEQRTKPVYVITADTLVETPVIVNYIDTTLERINKAARTSGMPFQAQKVQPTVNDSFWVNMLGRGYPAPSNKFRWCTERLKIKPANRFIMDQVAQYGEVVLVLGVRTSESNTRAQIMSLHRIRGSRLSRHSDLLNAFVYPVIEAFSLDDVWTYLLQNESPWGSDNRDLVAMYRNANAGECPLVVDKTTPSCGNSRFGCWTCTVVTTDRTMEGLIDSGEEWLEPLLNFRDLLAETQNPERKREFREFRRRHGRVDFIRGTAKPVPGPYKLEFCRELLRKLLETQLEVKRNAPPGEAPELISEAELQEIRRLWRMERGDWEDSLPPIVDDILGAVIDWVQDDQAAFGGADGELLSEICARHNVPGKLVSSLLDVERAVHGLRRRHSIHQKIEGVLSQEWRPESEVVDEREQELAREAESQT